MPNGKPNRKSKRPVPRARAGREAFTRDSTASRNIVRGISGIANSFMPGAGTALAGVARLFGVGAYDSDTAGKLFANSVPQMHATLDEGIRICHHEFIADISSLTTFGVSTFPLNPGMSSTFPWLSTLASSFNCWRANGIVFYFKSTSATALNSTNTALGQIIGCVDYNPYHSAPANKTMALGISGARDGKPSESNIYPVECKKDMTVIPTKLLRGTAVSDDLAKYDLGNFFLAANGSQAQALVGELHVAYDITLMKPRLGNSGWNSYYTSTDFTDTNTLGATGIIRYNGLGVSVNLTSRTITIPAGVLQSGARVLINALWAGSSAVTTTVPTITLTNASTITTCWLNASGAYVENNGVNQPKAFYLGGFQVTDGTLPVVLTFGTATLPTGTKTLDIKLTEIANDST